MKELSVSEFNAAISAYLEQGLGSVAVRGEVVDFHTNRDRLVYFELKDEKSRVLCFALKWEMTSMLEDGMEVIVVGVPKLFQGTGGFHIRVQAVELKGEGTLRRAYELTRKKLEAEGLFDEQYKKPLPRFPERIGLVTSHEAAAYTDVLRILKNRWCGLEIYLASVQVQGAAAVNQIARAIEYFNASFPVDVLLLTRGGGSLEDLQAFNSEKVVRAVFASKIPIVVGVGHERDETLAEYAADVRASTPSNAAEMMVQDRREVLYQVTHMEKTLTGTIENEISGRLNLINLSVHRLERVIQGFLSVWRSVLQRFQQTFLVLHHRVDSFTQRQTVLRTRLIDRVDTFLREQVTRLDHMRNLLQTLNPAATLKRGYSITFQAGKVLKSVKHIQSGSPVWTKLADGEFESRIL